MSYILDALRKAERQRLSGGVPTLDTLHGARKGARRAVWPWVITGGVVVAAAVVLLMWPTFRVGAPTVVSPTAVTPMGATPAAPELAPPPATTPPEPIPAAPRPAGPAAKPPGARTADAGAPVRPPAGGSTRPRAAAPPPPPEGTPPGAPGGDLRAVVPAVPAPPPASPIDPLPAAPRPADPVQPAPGALSTAPETAAKLTLDVLVYSERETERMVFINSRKYVEGQTVDGKLVLEAITRDGAILSYQGRRFLLRPRSNPYVQP